MAGTRTIAVVTGTRAEWGLLSPVASAIAAQRGLRLRIVAAGLHLVNGTWRDITAAGLAIDARVPMQQRGTTGRAADAMALGRGVRGFAQAFQRLQPRIVLVLGDRIEAFAAAAAASIAGIHVAHVHGGDRAEGVADEAMRHAISKLAHLHFSATAQSRRRLIRMGEPPTQVWNVGSPAIDGLRDIAPADNAPTFIVMQHPIGADDAQEERWMRATLAAMPARAPLLLLAPNRDPGSRGIRAALRGRIVTEHLPRPRFVSQLKAARAIVGNSSAGLIEAAALRVPCVNIGPRQGGREKPGNVIDCHYGANAVRAALRKAVQLNLRRMRHPYGDGHAGPRMARILATVDLAAMPLRKRNSF